MEISESMTDYQVCCDRLSGICDQLTAYGVVTTHGGLTACRNDVNIMLQKDISGLQRDYPIFLNSAFTQF